MDYLHQVQQGIDYVEEHLDEDIALHDVSRVAGVSHWHFLRMFKALTDETLRAYVRARRMVYARRSLLETRESVLTIAVAAGFESQEAFARAFKRTFGVTPTAFRRFGDDHLFLEKPRIDEDYLRHLHTGMSTEPRLEDAPPRTMVGLATSFDDPGAERNTIAARLSPLWTSFMSRFAQVEKKHSHTAYGVIGQEAPGSARIRYIAAAHVIDGPCTVPPGMIDLKIPAATYATFEHRGTTDQLDRTVNYIYSAWLMQSGMRHTYGPDLETYGERYRPTSSDSVVLYSIPVRPA